MTRVVVAGGGVSGLAAARGLVAAGLDVTVLEGSPRWGGKLAPVEVDGVRLDGGAEAVLARRPEAVDLATDLGLPVVHPTAAQPAILSRGRPVPVPRSVLGVPADLDGLAGLLSIEGLERARSEPERPAPPLPADVGVGAVVADRFGPEVVDRLLEPVLAGIYAGRSKELSFAAVNPALYARARGGGSLLTHARELRAETPPGPVFAGVTGGLYTLIEALVTDLARHGVELRTGTVVRELSRRGRGWAVAGGPATRAETMPVDAVVLAVPAAPASRLLHGLVPRADDLGRLPYASGAVVTLLVGGLVPSGSGLLVPPEELPTVKALTYSSAKWDWVRAVAPDHSVVRVSVGRVGEERVLQVPDGELIARSFAEVARLPGWEDASLMAAAVTRWGASLAQYLVGHGTLVANLRAGVERLPGLAVCGAFLDGVGVAACVASADAAVAKVTADLAG